MLLPLISCIMPTYGRPDYVAESLGMFLAQDYPAKELIILNDCPGQRFLGDFPGVKIFNVNTRWQHLGAKRNAAIELASGEYIAVWDDDDVYLPWRLSHSMRHMEETKCPFYCPAEFWAYWGQESLHDNQAIPNWICHPAHLFRRDLWASVGGYPEQTHGEDIGFLAKVLEHLAMDWPRDTISRRNRFFIMRGHSKYSHTSLGGGQRGPDVTTQEVVLQPNSIGDPVLRAVSDRLVLLREETLRRQQILRKRAVDWPGLPPGVERLWLDQWKPYLQQVGFQQLGLYGELGYEGRRVEICGETFLHAISAHAPSRLKYSLSGHFTHFCCQVALNDDVPREASGADFLVFVDGQLKGVARNVRAGHFPRLLTVRVDGARELELVTQYQRWDYCHSVWCDPFLISLPETEDNQRRVDCLERAEITIPERIRSSALCIATVASAEFAEWVDDLLGSICANAQCPNAQLAIFSFEDSDEIRRIAEKYRAIIVPCQSITPLSCAAKSVLYSVARVIPAEKYICVDADMLVMDDLRPIVAAMEASPPGSVFACREGVWESDLGSAIRDLYSGSVADINDLVSTRAATESSYSLVVNDGLFAGTSVALSALDDTIRGLHNAVEWLDERRESAPWANQLLFNLALAQCQCGVELDPRFNVQLNSQFVTFQVADSGVIATMTDTRRAAIVHFNGGGRTNHAEWRGRYRAVAKSYRRFDSESQAYQRFLEALRPWVGEHGRDVLAWSYYGTPDGYSGRESDGSEFPLFAALYYLIKSNGCQRVIETGTARGVSAAILTAAVAHHQNAIVVTIDVTVYPERVSLWSKMPLSFQDRIVARQGDSIEELKNALANGESYDVAILDTVHSAEHVLGEFEYARQLVCPGGLILIHDAILASGTVRYALDRITEMGYGVTRLWTAEGGCQVDAGMGLAVIENRRYGSR